jgi:drug/metabolite transporter (DMT)-like permease
VSADRDKATTRRAWIAWSLVCLIWGTTYLFIKIALDTIPPFLLGGIRYVTGGALLAAILAARGQPLPPRADWGRFVVLGFFMLLLGNGGVVWGEQYISSGLTAVLIGTSPFWMVGMDGLFSGGSGLTARQSIGLAVGFAGIVLLVWPDITSGGAGAAGVAMGVVAVQIACAGWAIGSAYTRRKVTPRDVLGSAALQMLFGGLLMLAVGTAAGEWDDLSLTPRTGFALAYLTLAGSVVAFAAYSYALRHMPVAVVSLYTYVNPVIAVALGVLVLGEPFGMRMLVAAGVIVLGIVVVGPMRSKSLQHEGPEDHEGNNPEREKR